ncbi:MAG TPA: carbonic anhydrase, partial [Candidatus Ozemobacteraceae bacterium]
MPDDKNKPNLFERLFRKTKENLDKPKTPERPTAPSPLPRLKPPVKPAPAAPAPAAAGPRNVK